MAQNFNITEQTSHSKHQQNKKITVINESEDNLVEIQEEVQEVAKVKSLMQTMKHDNLDGMTHNPYLTVIISVASITGFCFCSQILLRYSKISNLSLNRYYTRRRFE